MDRLDRGGVALCLCLYVVHLHYEIFSHLSLVMMTFQNPCLPPPPTLHCGSIDNQATSQSHPPALSLLSLSLCIHCSFRISQCACQRLMALHMVFMINIVALIRRQSQTVSYLLPPPSSLLPPCHICCSFAH